MNGPLSPARRLLAFLSQEHVRPMLFFGSLALAFVVSVGALMLSAASSAYAPTEDVEELIAEQRREDARAAMRDLAELRFAESLGSDAYLTTDLPGAIVWIDADSVGPAPVLLTDLMAGTYEVEVRGRNGISINTTLDLPESSFRHLHIESPRPRNAARAPAPRVTIERVEPAQSRVGWAVPTQRPPVSPPVEPPRTPSRVAW